MKNDLATIERSAAVLDALTRGETGESGENPRQQTNSTWRTVGERWRNGGELDVDKATAAAAKILHQQPRETLDYPLEALGALAEPCAALAEGGQLRPAMAGQSLLTVASLLVQGTADVRTLAGIKPTSLFALTIADSGDGKSTADQIALHSVRERQRADSAAYQCAQEAAERAPKGEAMDFQVPPYRIMRDGTVEGIRQGFKVGLPSQGVFTAEAAAMICGYGMSPDNRAKTAATFNALWDDGELSVGRAMTGRTQLYDRRLAIHWQIQPDAARSAIMDPLLSGIGFWPRFLIAWPESAPPRQARPFRAESDSRISEFWKRCDVLLSRAVGADCSDNTVLQADAESESLACKFFERMEQAAKARNGLYVDIKPFALRATEQVFRVAGVLACFGGRQVIDGGTMRGAIRLVAHSLETWRGIFGDRDEADAKQAAMELYRWLLKQPDRCSTETAILKLGPRRLRSRSARDTALALLEQARLVMRGSNAWIARVPDEDR